MGRGGVVKLDCYRVVGMDKEDNAEIRQISHKLVLPASSIAELVNVVKGIQSAAKK